MFPVFVASVDSIETEPIILQSPSNISTIVDRNLTLACEVEGFPAPVIFWYKRENSTSRWHPILHPSSPRVVIQRGMLSFRRLLASDSAYYRCSAENSKGSKFSAPAYLSVQAPVTFVSRPNNRTVQWGKLLELQCEVIGIPFPYRWWTKNGVKVFDASTQATYSNPRLEINATESAKYECLAENSHIEGHTKVSQAYYVTVIDGYCYKYNESVCNDFISLQPVYLKQSNHNAIGQGEIKTEQLLNKFKEAGNASCFSRVHHILCRYNFPSCIKAGRRGARPVELCRESCIAVRDLFCKVEWRMLKNTNNRSMPECDNLPSKYNSSIKCVYVDLFNVTEDQITTSCYSGDGSFYRGMVNVTETGLVCQAWNVQVPNRHNYFPSVYPILEDSGNACRNAGGERVRPWCYTLNLSVHWQYCNVTPCDALETTDNSTLLVPSAFNIEMGFILATAISIPVTMLILIAVICLRIVLPNIRKPKKKPSSEIDISVLVNIPKSEAEYPFPELKHLEYQRNRIAYQRDIGEGAFGNIFLADVPDIAGREETVSVVKTLHDKATLEMEQDFIREATILAQFKHLNILEIFGVCFIGRPWCVLLEYMPNGDLNEFLQSCDTRQHSIQKRSHDSIAYMPLLSFHEQLKIARQIAAAMVYIAEKRYIHRDLATRNCLIGNELTVKISDFGLAVLLGSGEDFHQGGEFEPIPIRWSPVESIVHNQFTHASDVWSFGIVLWEIFTFGMRPYYKMTQEEVVNYVRQGKVLCCPDNTPSEVYELMRICWNQEPNSRPRFSMLHDSLIALEEEMKVG